MQSKTSQTFSVEHSPVGSLNLTGFPLPNEYELSCCGSSINQFARFVLPSSQNTGSCATNLPMRDS